MRIAHQVNSPLQQVDRRPDEDPDQIDEAPVEARDLEPVFAGQPLCDPVRRALNELKDFLLDHVYRGSAGQGRRQQSAAAPARTVRIFRGAPGRDGRRGPSVADAGQTSVQRAVCDFLAGMTDRFAIRTHERLFVPRAWEN
ncbi:MAG TPA: hypothetical protein VKW09_05885 [bacterium]|nr:hypothetical protein [bacterium]